MLGPMLGPSRLSLSTSSALALSMKSLSPSPRVEPSSPVTPETPVSPVTECLLLLGRWNRSDPRDDSKPPVMDAAKCAPLGDEVS